MYGKTAKDYAIECGHAIKIVPLLEAGVGDQKAALEAIFGSSKKKKRESIDPRKIVQNFKNRIHRTKEKIKYKVLTPHRKYKEWYYKKYLEPGKYLT